MRFFVALAALVVTSGCAVFHDDAASLLARGRYVEALELLRDDEAKLAAAAPADRARYALYRGLVCLALDDRAGTDRWLGEAKALYDDEPSRLSVADAGKLLGAWGSLGRGR